MITSDALTGKTAIVTGAGRGIGRSVALLLAQYGANVALASRTESELQSVQVAITKTGSNAISVPTDLSDERNVIALVKQTVEQFSGLDIVVNNAAIGLFGPLEKTSTADWDRLMAINARGPFILCREAIPHLRQQKKSHIINISSVVGHKGYANQSLYSASKHAIMGMTKALAKELHSDGIRVHAICPGGVDTNMVGDARPDLDRSILIHPDEIAEMVLFLATREGNAVIDAIDCRRESSTPWV